MAIVSVVIPVYNVEQYLEECLESILTQSYRDLEVICVNDGSTDGSADILEQFRCRDSRLRVITIENQGVAVARNIGIEAAAGKYIYFVDSDDYILPGSLEKMVEAAESQNLDSLIVRVDAFSDDGNYSDLATAEKQSLCFKGDYHGVYSGVHLMGVCMESGDIWKTVWLFMVRKDLLEENQIHFVPHVIYEDVLYTTKILTCAKRAAVLDQIVYMRRMHAHSIVTSEWGFESFRSALICFMGLKQWIMETAVYEEALQVYKRITESQKLTVHFYSRLDEQQKQRVNQLSSDMQFVFYTDIAPHLEAEDKIKEILTAFDHREKDIATLEAALNQREKDVATLENALNQRAAEVAALESKLKAIEETWLYKAASRIIKG